MPEIKKLVGYHVPSLLPIDYPRWARAATNEPGHVNDAAMWRARYLALYDFLQSHVVFEDVEPDAEG